MIWITGDVHRDFTHIKRFCEMNNTSKDDIMICLGDVGINYLLNEKDYLLKKELSKYPITFFCLHGNHEERPYNLPGYKEKEWHGAKAYINPEFPNQVFAKDGEIYSLNNKKVLTIGGAYSVDKHFRIARGWKWFESEQPNEEIKEHVIQTLDKVDWCVDFVLSHTCPYNYMPRHLFLLGINQDTVDNSTEEWLQEIEDKLQYDQWYFGHFHDYYVKDKMTMLFRDILKF